MSKEIQTFLFYLQILNLLTNPKYYILEYYIQYSWWLILLYEHLCFILCIIMRKYGCRSIMSYLYWKALLLVESVILFNSGKIFYMICADISGSKHTEILKHELWHFETCLQFLLLSWSFNMFCVNTCYSILYLNIKLNGLLLGVARLNTVSSLDEKNALHSFFNLHSDWAKFN